MQPCKKNPLVKIKISCLIYADSLLRFNRSYLSFFRERVWLKDYLPSSFTWAWDQQDLTAKQVNPGGVVGIKIKKIKKSPRFLLQNGAELLDHVVDNLLLILLSKTVTSI